MQVSRLRHMRGLLPRWMPRGLSVMPSFSITAQPPGCPMMDAPRMAEASTMRFAMLVSMVCVGMLFTPYGYKY